MLTDEEIKKSLIENDIKNIYLQFVDINGRLKTLNLPASQIDEILSNDIMFDGSAISGFRENETMDLHIYPDKSTFMVFPFKFSGLKNTARFICDIHNADGTPFDGCPRSNLKRVIQEAQKIGYTMKIGPEVEFFLFKKGKDDEIISQDKEKNGYYDINRNTKYDDAIWQILIELQKMGYEIDALHHEGAPFQHEIA